jgi:uncharacterized protein YeaO (DUF488 family)
MTLYLRCILEEPDPSDGMRVSVMSRHTLSNGVTADIRIQPVDVHMPVLGPSPLLIGDYYKRNLCWEKFEERYLEELRSIPKKIKALDWLIRLVRVEDVTLLCIEETAHKCHRRLLAQVCKEKIPRLRIVYR